MIHEQHIAWLEARGISLSLAERFGLQSAVASFPPEGETEEWTRAKCISIPFLENGVAVNHKYRRVEPKQHVMDKGGKRCLFNLDAVKRAAGGTLVITEGEWDAMVAEDLGWAASSVPNGTPEKVSDDAASENRYSYLWDVQDELAKVDKFILATDGDAPGLALRQDLVSLLTPERCSFLVYPDDCKDLTDVRVKWGVEEASRVLTAAKPFPVKGLYSFSDMPEPPPLRTMATGIDCLDPLMQIVLGTITVFTGYANMGKTTVMDTIIAHAVDRGANVCVASFETSAKPILMDALAKALLGTDNASYEAHPGKDAALATLEARVSIITNALDESLEFDIDTFLDTAATAVRRHGIRLLVLDPWNELEHKRRRDETLTEYVGRAIRRVKAFARRYNVAVWIVAHPTKPLKGDTKPPSLYDISDSAHWANKPDYGLVFHRADKEKNEAILAVSKVRKGLPGHCGQAMVKYDHRVNRVNAY